MGISSAGSGLIVGKIHGRLPDKEAPAGIPHRQIIGRAVRRSAKIDGGGDKMKIPHFHVGGTSQPASRLGGVDSVGVVCPLVGDGIPVVGGRGIDGQHRGGGSWRQVGGDENFESSSLCGNNPIGVWRQGEGGIGTGFK